MVYLYKALIKFGSLDMERAQECLDSAGVYTDQFADYVYQYMKEAGCTFDDLDIVSMAYQFIAYCADVPELIDSLFSNCLDTRFDISPKEAKKILRKVPKNLRNQAWLWLQQQIA